MAKLKRIPKNQRVISNYTGSKWSCLWFLQMSSRNTGKEAYALTFAETQDEAKVQADLKGYSVLNIKKATEKLGRLYGISEAVRDRAIEKGWAAVR